MLIQYTVHVTRQRAGYYSMVQLGILKLLVNLVIIEFKNQEQNKHF